MNTLAALAATFIELLAARSKRGRSQRRRVRHNSFVKPDQRTESRCQLLDRMRPCMPPRLAASPSSRLKIFARGACGAADTAEA